MNFKTEGGTRWSEDVQAGTCSDFVIMPPPEGDFLTLTII